MTPRIFVGTMECGEEEFEESKSLIMNQSDVEIEHFIIQNMHEYEAHNLLWSTWMEARGDFNLFIKVDADTLVDDPRMFLRIWSEFERNHRLTGMQIPIKDYFTDSLIAGLNCFSPTVVFRQADNRLYADHADTNHDITMKGDSVLHLTPAGRHCAYPNKKQAFHYGLHRMKKGQVKTIRNVLDAWNRIGGDGRLIALHGAATALRKKVDHDYNTSSFEDEFNCIVDSYGSESLIEEMLKVIERL